MTGIFEAKVRRIGNAKGVIIPKEILDEANAKEGENIQLMIPIAKSQRMKAFNELLGLYPDAKPFKREYEDRY
jgi:antitoxin component of MazEF toxin-antitoxin module